MKKQMDTGIRTGAGREPERKETTCCFSGHRPEKLPWGNDEERPDCLALKERLTRELEKLYLRGYRHFVCGMARGADFYFAEGVAALREKYPDVTLEGAVPCPSQSKGWDNEEKDRYMRILDVCNIQTLIQPHYSRGCMFRRNRYMVDKSSTLLCVYDGSGKGGTKYTLSYAMEQGLHIQILEI